VQKFQSTIACIEARRLQRLLCQHSVEELISGFHRALLQSATFTSRLMHSVIQNVDVKIYVV